MRQRLLVILVWFVTLIDAVIRTTALKLRSAHFVDLIIGIGDACPYKALCPPSVQVARSRGGPAQHPGMVCKRCARRFHVDYSIASADWLARGKVQLCGPPPGLPLRDQGSATLVSPSSKIIAWSCGRYVFAKAFAAARVILSSPWMPVAPMHESSSSLL